MTARDFGEDQSSERPRERLHKVYRSDGRVEWLTRKQLHALNTAKHERKVAAEKRARQLKLGGAVLGVTLVVGLAWFVVQHTGGEEHATLATDTAALRIPSDDTAPASIAPATPAAATGTDTSPVESPSGSIPAPDPVLTTPVSTGPATLLASVNRPVPAAILADPSAAGVSAGSVDQDAIMALLTRWAGCWSRQDLNCYLANYAPLFTPTHPTIDQASWRDQRAQRLAAPDWIEVTVSNVTVQRVNNDLVRARFLQHYRNPGYEDRGYKLMTITRIGDGWQILLEEPERQAGSR